MKKSIFILAIMSGALFASCKSNSEKKADAVENVVEANKDLNNVTEEINTDNVTKENDSEWQTFKMEAYKSIANNEIRITELQKAVKKPGNTFDEAYRKSIEILLDKNIALKNKISNYENNQTDWTSFKREFNSDMNELGQAFKDLTVNNKK